MKNYVLTHAKVVIFHTKITAEDTQEALFQAYEKDIDLQVNFPDIPNLPKETEVYEVKDESDTWLLDEEEENDADI